MLGAATELDQLVAGISVGPRDCRYSMSKVLFCRIVVTTSVGGVYSLGALESLMSSGKSSGFGGELLLLLLFEGAGLIGRVSDRDLVVVVGSASAVAAIVVDVSNDSFI